MTCWAWRYGVSCHNGVPWHNGVAWHNRGLWHNGGDEKPRSRSARHEIVASSRLRTCCEPVTDLLRTCKVPVTDLLRTCKVPVTNLLRICYEPVAKLLRTCYEPVAKLWRTLPRFSCCGYVAQNTWPNHSNKGSKFLAFAG